MSSTAIVLKILKESWDINRNYWIRSLWILLFQDLMVILILLLLTIISNWETWLFHLFFKTIFAASILIIIMWGFWKYLLDYFLYRVARTNSNEIFIWSVLFIIIWASLLSFYLWFSYTLWSFIAWMLIAETHYKHKIEADFIAFRDLLLWFFFITVWMQLNLSIVYNYIWTILILFSWFMLLKILLFYRLLRIFLNRWASIKTTLALFQFWEFGIVIFELANTKWLLDTTLSHILIVVIILSMIITPIILKNVYKITDFFLWIRNIEKDYCFLPTNLKKHVILIWYSRLWKMIWKMLEENNIEYVILENNIRIFKSAKKEWKPIVYWNAHQINTLNHLRITEADSIIITIWENEWLFLVAWVISKLNIPWKIIVRASDNNEEQKLKELNINEIIVEAEKTANWMFSKI